jgi:carboxyl-terminal processing protease
MGKRILSLVLIIVMMPILSHQVQAKTDEEYLMEIQETINLIHELYVGEGVTKEELYQSALDGIESKLDDYSGIYTQEEAMDLVSTLQSDYVGIGVGVQMVEDAIVITQVFEGGDALEEGVMLNDQIIRVNGEDVLGQDIDTVVSKIKGPEGTFVNVDLQRGNRVISLTIERRQIMIPSIEAIDLRAMDESMDETFIQQVAGYRVDSFSEGTDEQLRQAILEKEEEGLEYVILDMRDNTGGYLDTAVNIGKFLIPEGVITSLVSKNGESQVYRSYLEDPSVKIVLLVNGNSASATEIFAAAVKESGAGVVIGETTFGKGVAQAFYQTNSGQIVKLTTEEFLSRDGNKINGVGVVPDIIVDMPEYILPEDRLYIGDQSQQVKVAEELLYYLGYLDEMPDESYERATFEAVKQFQADVGLYSYGVCDYTTQTALNVTYLEARENNDLQMQRAIEWIKEDKK